MNAQEIKSILIACLKAANREIRIYQEKSIEDAVCDLMMAPSACATTPTSMRTPTLWWATL